MSLSPYKQKRNFSKTKEPAAIERSSKGALRFVVQKHDATQVHYDFRLEMEGVLKSWAVPKGPSLNPADKRLAMAVEDHPYDYRRFEGVIPEGEYGGGTVIVWDEGTYTPAGAENLNRKEQEEALLRGLQAGKISFLLQGQKLKGDYTLFKMKGRNENAWMLVKKKDQWSSDEDISDNEASVVSGKTLAEVAKEHGTEVHHPEAPGKSKKEKPSIAQRTAAPSKKSGKAKQPNAQETLKTVANKSAGKTLATLPKPAPPMLATLTDEAFDNEDWIFEIKWDGYRAIAYCNKKNVELFSRNQKPFTNKYRPIAEALASLNIEAVLDGEIVAVNDKGLADFQALQNWQNTPVHLRYYIFDIVWLNGQNLTKVPLIERKKKLKKLLPAKQEIIKYSDHVVGTGIQFFDAAVKQGLEGIMAKRADSGYQFDSRTPDWLKIKVALRQEVIIAGYTEPRNSRKFFGSLLLGVYSGKDLVYVGHTGSGFTKKSLEEIYQQLQNLRVDQSPFAKPPKTNMPPTWVKPQLVCEIKFTEWTADHHARHAIFMGLRQDKKAKDVHFEKSTTMARLKETAQKKAPAKKRTTASRSKAKNTGSPAGVTGNEQTLQLEGIKVQLTNLQKIYWPKEGFRKGDVVNYYQKISPYILPYLLERPQSLNRHPNGINGPHFFQKNMKGKLPDWIETFQEFSESTGENVDYLVCSNEATLIYMANLGCIEINPWHARKQHYLKPDWCLIDLDPDKRNSFDQVVEVANTVGAVLENLGVVSCPKTSGSTGLHIYIPLGAAYNFEQSKTLAELVVKIVHQELPKLTSMERTPAKRKGKIYLDYLQNKETQTAAAPYSLRPKPGVPVSTPLHWSEIRKGLTPTTWNAFNIFDRVKTEGDLFAPVLGKGIDLESVVQTLKSLI